MDDINIQDIFEVDFVLTYIDTSDKNGMKLGKPLVEDKRVSAEEFTEEMIKYRKSNI